MTQTIYNTLWNWKLENLICEMWFDTTNFNTGRNSGACVLEQLLKRNLLSFACRHHILEIVLGADVLEYIGTTLLSDFRIFKRFQPQ